MSYKDNICQVKHSDRSSKGRVTLITLMLFITRLMFPSKIHLLPIHHKQIQEDNLINNRLVQTLFSQVKMLFSNRFRIEWTKEEVICQIAPHLKLRPAKDQAHLIAYLLLMKKQRRLKEEYLIIGENLQRQLQILHHLHMLHMLHLEIKFKIRLSKKVQVDHLVPHMLITWLQKVLLLHRHLKQWLKLLLMVQLDLLHRV